MFINYPGIYKVALEIAYANGGINRDRSEEQMTKEYMKWIEDQNPFPYTNYIIGNTLIEIDEWISTLTEDQIETLADGEETDWYAITKNSPHPKFTEQLLENYFNEIC